MSEPKHIDWPRWKHGMVGYANAYGIHVPDGFTANSPNCGSRCRSLIGAIQKHVGLHVTHEMGDFTRPYVAPFLEPRGFREKILVICRSAVANAGEWHYHQWRPYQRSWHAGQSFNGDCSGSTEMLDLMAGAKDPSGWGFNGQGNTSSIGAHSKRIPRAYARPGDMVLWTGHICVLLKPGPDPLLFSMGMEAGPFAIRLSVEDRYHGGSPIFLQAVAR